MHDLTGPVPPCRIVKEKRATFAATPAQDARRPAARTPWANLFLAGDWTDTGLPATIEGALRSGNTAASLVGAGRRLIACRRMASTDSTYRRLDDDIDRAAQALMRRQRDDGHWVFELEADATIPSEYVLLRHYLGEPDDLELERKIAAYLRRIQGEHGGWPLFHGGAFDISASVKAYFCLKMIGDSPDAPHMAKARNAILAHGGAEQANVFTRILLAQFGQLPWAHVPTMPVEIILLPRWFPIHLSRMSYWARTVIVPLLVLAALRQRARNPRGSASRSSSPRRAGRERKLAPHQHRGWALFFNALDRVLKAAEPLWPKRCANAPSIAASRFVTERLNGEDGLGAIYPAMANSVMMYDALGYPRGSSGLRHRPAARSTSCWWSATTRPTASPASPRSGIPRLPPRPCWRSRTAAADAAALGGLAGCSRCRSSTSKGDWSERRPERASRRLGVPVPQCALSRSRRHRRRRHGDGPRAAAIRRGPGYDEAIARGVEWIAGLQSGNGGWAAFDADNVDHYLNNIPFADHGALLDPPTADVSARCISMLAQLGETPASPAMRAGLDYLEREQDAGRQLVRPLGRQLHLRHMVGAVRAQRRRLRRHEAERTPRPPTG